MHFCIADKGYEYTGAMEILEQIIYYEYLWPQLREKQGVYSFFTNIGRDGIVYFVTLMDPNYAESFKVFAGIPDFLRSYSADQSTIDGYIIKEVGKLDRPVSNSALGRISYSSYMADMKYDDYQKKRDEILGTTVETIRSFADFMEAVLEDSSISCVGSREKIKEYRDLFNEVEELDSISNAMDNNAIVTIKGDKYSFDITCLVSEMSRITLYKQGKYTFTFTDTVGNSYDWDVFITGQSLYEDVIGESELSYTDFYNSIYLNQKDHSEEIH